MILIRNIKTRTAADTEQLRALAADRLGIQQDRIETLSIEKRSVDARKKPDVYWVYSVAVRVKGNEAGILRSSGCKDAVPYENRDYAPPTAPEGIWDGDRPVVVGFGPAGMFAALLLAKAGARPVVLERGQEVENRQEAVRRLRENGTLDPESNVQFGEGGAGTFSDGKLNTGTKDPRIGWVLEQFVRHGAPEHIRYDAKPHIGTDVLVRVVRSFREEVLALGGEIRFETRMERLCLSGGRVSGLEISAAGKKEILPCSSVILATGHSARDTFENLCMQGVPMERKPFSMGVRIEHLQEMTDRSQYGRPRDGLPAADYSLHVHLPDGNSAYTFCMCPGGEVFAAASETGGVVTNGMSYSGRSGENSNSALLVTLKTADFPEGGVLSGMYWQRDIEQAAYRYGGGNYLAPAQLVGDFLGGKPSTGPRTVRPTYRPGVVWGELREVLPEKITEVLREALPELGKRMQGFDDPDAVMTAPETRSSSPVRIVRDAGCESAVGGLFPCGEGAGYAGGITSAAVDGLRCAEAVIRKRAAQEE